MKLDAADALVLAGSGKWLDVAGGGDGLVGDRRAPGVSEIGMFAAGDALQERAVGSKLKLVPTHVRYFFLIAGKASDLLRKVSQAGLMGSL